MVLGFQGDVIPCEGFSIIVERIVLKQQIAAKVSPAVFRHMNTLLNLHLHGKVWSYQGQGNPPFLSRSQS